MNPITVVGSINADLMVSVERHPTPGETVPGSGGTVSPGGKGANQAVAAAFMGGKVSMVGAVGNDENSKTALKYLKASGVNLDHVASRGDVTGLAIVTVDATGENNIIVIPGANAQVDSTLLEDAYSTIADAAVVVLQGEIPVDSIAKAAQLARGRLIVNLAPVVDVSTDVLLKADPLVVNEYEAALALKLLQAAGVGAVRDGEADLLASSLATNSDEGDTDVSARFTPLAQQLLAAGVPSVVMTIGAAGAIVVTKEETTAVPSPEVEVVDTTGAGDAFVGGLATRLADGDDLETAVRFAVRVGAAACRAPGAQSSYPHSPNELPGSN